MKILVVNPGSTSTKMAVYDDEKPLLLRNISHTAEQLAPFGNIIEHLREFWPISGIFSGFLFRYYLYNIEPQ